MGELIDLDEFHMERDQRRSLEQAPAPMPNELVSDLPEPYATPRPRHLHIVPNPDADTSDQETDHTEPTDNK